MAIAATQLRGEFFTPREGEVLPGYFLKDLIEGKYGLLRAVRIHGARFQGSVDLAYINWRGLLELQDCTIDGDLDLSYTHIEGLISLDQCQLELLDLRDANVNGSVNAHSLMATRGIIAIGATISGALRLHNSDLTAPSDQEIRSALGLYRASVTDVFLNGAKIHGGVYAIGCTIARNIRFTGAEIWSRRELGWDPGTDTGEGIALSSARIGGTISFGPTDRFTVLHGVEIDLDGSVCNQFSVNAEQLKTYDISIENFHYARLRGCTGDDILALLDRTEPFPRFAYSELAAYAGQNGDEQLQRLALVRQQKRITESLPKRSLRRIYGRALDLLTGYGYHSERAIIWLVGCFAVAWSILSFAGNFVQPVNGTPGHLTKLGAILLTLDHLVPFATSGYRDQWSFSPTGGWQWAAALGFEACILLAWTFSALFIASVTGLIRKR